jgi:hypothetical protein
MMFTYCFVCGSSVFLLNRDYAILLFGHLSLHLLECVCDICAAGVGL